jgi:colicin import membrane protein
MSRIITPQEAPYAPPPPPEDGDEFPLGWRYVTRKLPDGSDTWDQVPLTLEDRLFPEEGDQIPDTPLHHRDREYCNLALRTQYEGDPRVAVVCDQLIDFDVARIRPMCPDLVVLFGIRVPPEVRAGTYRIARHGGHAVVALEFGSPSTRTLDVERKPPLFYRIGIEKYVFVDRGPRGDAPAQLRCYRRGARTWVQMTPDATGRYDLAPVSVLIGLEQDLVWLYDAKTGERILDHSETVQRQLSAEEKARDEAQARASAETKAKKAEAKAKKAEAKAKKEAQARAEAEARIRDEAKQRAALEARLRELEAQLRQQGE